jgi:adenosine deaminase
VGKKSLFTWRHGEGEIAGFRFAHKGFFLSLILALTFLPWSAGPARGDGLIKAAPARCTDPNSAVVSYFNIIHSSPPELAEAIRKFPKGADIHNHLSGTDMPEDYISMGIADGDCYARDLAVPDGYTIDPNTGTHDACKPGDIPLSRACSGDRQKLVMALSMHNFKYTDIQSGHDHFFATFGRFGAVSGSAGNRGKMLAKLLQQANADTVSYVETMMSFQSPAVGKLADMLRQNFAVPKYYTDSIYYREMYDFLIKAGLKEVVAAAQKDITGSVDTESAALKCGAADQDPACRVSYAFLAEINRNSAKADKIVDLPKIFSQTAMSFLLADTEKRVVGVNLVSGEDLPVSMDNFRTEMKFFSFFHKLFPKVNIALHAGEITPCFVGTGNPALKDHITESLNAGAKRIGHGISFEYLNDADREEVVKLMKSSNALVEILLTSNAQILGVTGSRHPFPLYYKRYRVPTAFSSDDEGVSYADYTDEWIYAYLQYGSFFGFRDMVALARYSMQYSFMPGDPLWTDVASARIAGRCAGLTPGSPDPPDPCKSFLANSMKATMQWNYEAKLSDYEKHYGMLFKKYRRKNRKVSDTRY